MQSYCFQIFNQFRFTDQTKFPKDAEIGAGAAFIEVNLMDSMDVFCPSYVLNSSGTLEYLIIHQVCFFFLSL